MPQLRLCTTVYIFIPWICRVNNILFGSIETSMIMLMCRDFNKIILLTLFSLLSKISGLTFWNYGKNDENCGTCVHDLFSSNCFKSRRVKVYIWWKGLSQIYLLRRKKIKRSAMNFIKAIYEVFNMTLFSLIWQISKMTNYDQWFWMWKQILNIVTI